MKPARWLLIGCVLGMWGLGAGQSPDRSGDTTSRPAATAAAPTPGKVRQSAVPFDQTSPRDPAEAERTGLSVVPSARARPYVQLIERAEDFRVAVSAYVRGSSALGSGVELDEALARRAARANGQEMSQNVSAALETLGSGSGTAWAVLARMYAARGEATQARAAADRALKLAKNDPIIQSAVQAVAGLGPPPAAPVADPPARQATTVQSVSAAPSGNAGTTLQGPSPLEQARQLDRRLRELDESISGLEAALRTGTMSSGGDFRPGYFAVYNTGPYGWPGWSGWPYAGAWPVLPGWTHSGTAPVYTPPGVRVHGYYGNPGGRWNVGVGLNSGWTYGWGGSWWFGP